MTNSVTGVAAKVMVAILGGLDLTGVVELLPGAVALPVQGVAVVRAGRVDAVHVGHQDLIEGNFCICIYICISNYICICVCICIFFFELCTLQSPQILPWSTSGQLCSLHTPSDG